MPILTRRSFLKSSAACAALSVHAAQLRSAQEKAMPPNPVHFLHDGIHLEPLEYAELLVKLSKDGRAKPDNYMAGGVVTELETTFAKLLGKESAVFVPTGTLANHLALRFLAEGKSRVLVPAESHIYCDSSDTVQRLSHFNMVPLGEGKATFTLAEVEAAHERAIKGPFPVPIGAISIECPVRRKQGQAFEFEEMKRVAGFARKNEIKMHLDGARLFMASAYTGITPREYATLFDTVYISLYKYFGAGTGAVLAGPKAIIDKVASARKMFGAGLFHAWSFAAVALHFADGFENRFRKAVNTAKELFAALEEHKDFRLESIPSGTNIFRLHVPEVDAQKYHANLRGRGVLLQPPRKDFRGFTVVVNETVSRKSAEELTRIFVDSLPG